MSLPNVYNGPPQRFYLIVNIFIVAFFLSGLDESMRSALTKLSSGSSLPESVEYDTDSLRKELTAAGYPPGPITRSTKRVYLLKLKQLKRDPDAVQSKPANGRGKGVFYI